MIVPPTGAEARAPGSSAFPRRCYIHIGTHKTGTTSIQAFLAANKQRFAEHGVLFPVSGSVDDTAVIAHHQLAKQLLGNPAFDPERGGLDALAAELRQTAARVACLTSEDLSFLHAAPDALDRLRDAVIDAGFEPRIVVYLRAQSSYCTAVYAENVRHGYRTSFEVYLRDILERGRYSWAGGSGPPFDYAVLLDRFAAVFGRDAIVARAYRSGARDTALLFSFAHLLVPKGTNLAPFDVPKIRYNGSLGFTDVLRLIGAPNAVSEERLRFTPIDVGKLFQLTRRFIGPNIALARRYHVVVPVFEPIDLALAFPWRKTRSKTRALRQARRALAAPADDGTRHGRP